MKLDAWIAAAGEHVFAALGRIGDAMAQGMDDMVDGFWRGVDKLLNG